MFFEQSGFFFEIEIFSSSQDGLYMSPEQPQIVPIFKFWNHPFIIMVYHNSYIWIFIICHCLTTLLDIVPMEWYEEEKVRDKGIGCKGHTVTCIGSSFVAQGKNQQNHSMLVLNPICTTYTTNHCFLYTTYQPMTNSFLGIPPFPTKGLWWEGKQKKSTDETLSRLTKSGLQFP